LKDFMAVYGLLSHYLTFSMSSCFWSQNSLPLLFGFLPTTLAGPVWSES
jgi:hypothetical protein